MARKRIELSTAAEDLIRAMMAKGGTVAEVTEALRAGPAPDAASATIGRRMAEMRDEVQKARVARRGATTGVVKVIGQADPEHNGTYITPTPVAVEPEPAMPTTPEEIPEGTSLETYDLWIARAERMADDAEAEGNLKEVANAGRLVGFFMSEKRKATPKPVPDPNDSPDFVALGAEVEARLLKMVDLVLEET